MSGLARFGRAAIFDESFDFVPPDAMVCCRPSSMTCARRTQFGGGFVSFRLTIIVPFDLANSWLFRSLPCHERLRSVWCHWAC